MNYIYVFSKLRRNGYPRPLRANAKPPSPSLDVSADILCSRGMFCTVLRLVALEHFDFGVEICNGLIHVWMDSRHDDGYEILHALVLDHGRLDDVVLALLLTREPTPSDASPHARQVSG